LFYYYTLIIRIHYIQIVINIEKYSNIVVLLLPIRITIILGWQISLFGFCFGTDSFRFTLFFLSVIAQLECAYERLCFT